MSDVVNRITCEHLKSVNTPDYPIEDWVINPDLSSLSDIPTKYWKCEGDLVLEMTQGEKDVVDATIEAEQASRRNGFIMDHAFHDNNKPYADNSSSVYKAAAIFMWPGSNIVGIPKQASTVIRKIGNDAGIRIYDSTNDVIVAEYSVTNEDFDIVAITDLVLLPEERCLLEIHIKKVNFSSISFEF